MAYKHEKEFSLIKYSKKKVKSIRFFFLFKLKKMVWENAPLVGK